MAQFFLVTERRCRDFFGCVTREMPWYVLHKSECTQEPSMSIDFQYIVPNRVVAANCCKPDD